MSLSSSWGGGGSDTGLPPKTLQFYILILQCRPTTTMCKAKKEWFSHSLCYSLMLHSSFVTGGTKYISSTNESPPTTTTKENPAFVIFHFHRNRVTFFNEACKNREIPCISEGHVVHFHSSSCYLASFISRWCLVFPAVMATCSHSQVWNCWNLHLLTRATTSVVSSSHPFFVT